jgi:hypothetical protein
VKLRKCLSVQVDTPIQAVLDYGALPYLIDLMKSDEHPYLQLEAAWCVTNMATGSCLQTCKLVEKGAVPIYVQLLGKNNINLVEQAVWGVGNLCSESLQVRDMFVNNNTMCAVVEVYEKVKLVNPNLRDQIIWAASNICRQKPFPNVDKIVVGLRMFAEVLKSASKKSVIVDCVWALNSMANAKTLQLFLESGVMEKLVGLLRSEDYSVLHPVLKIVGVFTNSDGVYCDVATGYPGDPPTRPRLALPARPRPARHQPQENGAHDPLEHHRRQPAADRPGAQRRPAHAESAGLRGLGPR